MTKIKLTESVSVSELKHMREVEGLSNAEIAKRVGCAVSTVIAYIGKQPKEMTKRNQMAGLRRAYSLPPLTETKSEIPDMPRESFKERCERLMAKEVEAEAEMVIGGYKAFKRDTAPEPVAKIIFPAGEPKDAPSTHDCKAQNPSRTVKEVEERMRCAYDEKVAMMAERKVDVEADKAREAHCKEMESARAAGDKMAVFRKTGNPVDIPHDATLGEISGAYFGKPAFDTRAHINELLAVFGPDVVRQYLRVALYALGTPDFRQVRREHLLDALNTLNKEATCND